MLHLRFVLALGPERPDALRQELVELVRRYREEPATTPAEARPVHVFVRLITAS